MYLTSHQEILKYAVETYGAQAQTLMVFEEMSELQKELCKHARGKDNQEAIAEEIADVQIMLGQMMNTAKARKYFGLRKVYTPRNVRI